MARPLAVALVSPRYAPAIGGVERVVQTLAEELAAGGMSVQVLTCDPCGNLPSQERIAGVLVRRFPTVARSNAYVVSPLLGAWLLRHASRFDLIHAHSYHATAALEAGLAARLHRKPFVFSTYYHGTGHSAIARALHAPYRLAGGWLVRHAATVICMTPFEESLLRRQFGAGIHTRVISPGVSLQRPLLPASCRDSGTLLAVGRLVANKQTGLLLRSLPFLPASFRATVIGDGPERAQLEALAAQLGVSARCRFLPHVRDDELAAWYGRAGVFFSVSRLESFGMNVLDAAAAGTKVVASDIPPHRYLTSFVPAGVISLVSPDCSPHQLAQVITAAAEPDAEPLDRQGWALPTWQQSVQQTLECYQSALGDNGVAAGSTSPVP